MICSTLIIGMSCRLPNRVSSRSRAMVPSAFMISQITAPGSNPDSRHRSTLASVCPARTSTPPSRARSGNIWPGETRSADVLSGSISTCTVRARSPAEIPVLTPERASTDTVNAVPSGAVLRLTIMGKLNRSTRWLESAVQISPRPYLAMKLMSSGVVNCAGRQRSPSFSRSSSSVMITQRPA